jgi:hypothetical protein
MSAFAYKCDTTEGHSLNKEMLNSAKIAISTKKSGPVTDTEIMETLSKELCMSLILSDTPAESSAPNLPKAKAIKGCSGV